MSRVTERPNQHQSLPEREIPPTPLAPADDHVKRVLILVLLINAVFFVGESVAGLLADSLGLIADALDMLADAAVYGLSLWAIGRTAARKLGVARFSGYLELSLAAFGLVEVTRRTLATDPEAPDFALMIGVSATALLANAICLLLLHRLRSPDAHLRASYVFTANDIVINLGVITAGVLVYATESRWPDLIIGGIVFVVVCRGALKILRMSKVSPVDPAKHS